MGSITKTSYGIDCKRMGSLYASALVSNASAKVEALPELQKHPKYIKLHDAEKQAVQGIICRMAGSMLLAAGYKSELVNQIMDGK